MINIEKKTIYFGYGDVQTGSGASLMLTFTGFKPPMEVGTEIIDQVIEYITEPIKLKFTSIEELMGFKKLVDEIDGETNTYFQYRDYVFDFSNYNPKSIEIILKHIKNLQSHFIYLMAC